jgi:hypothetical protein
MYLFQKMIKHRLTILTMNPIMVMKDMATTIAKGNSKCVLMSKGDSLSIIT